MCWNCNPKYLTLFHLNYINVTFFFLQWFFGPFTIPGLLYYTLQSILSLMFCVIFLFWAVLQQAAIICTITFWFSLFTKYPATFLTNYIGHFQGGIIKYTFAVIGIATENWWVLSHISPYLPTTMRGRLVWLILLWSWLGASTLCKMIMWFVVQYETCLREYVVWRVKGILQYVWLRSSTVQY